MKKLTQDEIKEIRKKKIATIKIAQTQLSLDDDTYRALLMRVTNKNSCTRLNLFELNNVIDELIKQGFVVKSKKHAKPKARGALTAMINKIGAILAEQKLPWNYAHAIAQKKFGIAQVHWLDADQCHSVVASLQIYANRQNRKKRNGT